MFLSLVTILGVGYHFIAGSLSKCAFQNWQSNTVQLLVIALVHEMDKEPDTLQPCSVDSLVDLLPSVTSCSCCNEFDNHTKCGPQEPGLFRPGFEFVNSNVAVEGNFETLILLILEDFLELIRGTFGNNSVLRDEAFFADLFYEGGRVSIDGYDQPAVVANSSSIWFSH
ncbi:hypothetical protein ACE6H2_012069 [Prunus campanulata]